MPKLDKDVYREIKAEADRVSAIMDDLIEGRISASQAEVRLGVKYKGLATRKSKTKENWVSQQLVAPLKSTQVLNSKLLKGLQDTAFGSLCSMLFGNEPAGHETRQSMLYKMQYYFDSMARAKAI